MTQRLGIGWLLMGLFVACEGGSTTPDEVAREFVKNNRAPSIQKVSIGELAKAGDMLVALPEGWKDSEGAKPLYQYQWMVNGQPVAGANGSSFVATKRGDKISWEVTPHRWFCPW